MQSRAQADAPRKTPVQARSAATVEAIFAATLQVLHAQGLPRLTTTRVAERAGVSVGTLYQYFPNKRSLLAATLERHLLKVVQAVEAAGAQAQGRTADAIGTAVVQAFVSAKLDDAQTSRALYAVAAELDGAAVVERMAQRAQHALCTLLSTASDRQFADVGLVAFVVSGAVVGPVQALMSMQASAAAVAALREQLVRLVVGYLYAASLPHGRSVHETRQPTRQPR